MGCIRQCEWDWRGYIFARSCGSREPLRRPGRRRDQHSKCRKYVDESQTQIRRQCGTCRDLLYVHEFLFRNSVKPTNQEMFCPNFWLALHKVIRCNNCNFVPENVRFTALSSSSFVNIVHMLLWGWYAIYVLQAT